MDNFHIARIASLIGDPTRTILLSHLMDGRAYTVGELCRVANVSASTGSEHLNKMLDAGLLRQAKQGRHKYFHLANYEVAEALESLARIQPTGASAQTCISKSHRALAEGRTCYDHLAGRLGVVLTQALLEKSYLSFADGNFSLTEPGEQFLSSWGIDCSTLRAAKRPLLKSCLDWTERRFHLGGSLGCAVLKQGFDQAWLHRARKGRGVSLTEKGRRQLQDQLNLSSLLGSTRSG